MPYYRVADITFEYTPKHKYLEDRMEKYKAADDAKPEIHINVSDALIEKFSQKYGCSLGASESSVSGNTFYTYLLSKNGIMLHSSAIIYKGGAYLFSADSGTGKSTHTGIWKRVFGDENVIMLNDDKPAIRIIDGKAFAYGTPWSGKHDISTNVSVPLKAVVFLERSENNWIRKADTKEALNCFVAQTVNKLEANRINNLFEMLDKIFKIVPMYKMGCNMSDEAAILAEKTLCGSC